MKLRLFAFVFCTLLLLGSREAPWGDAHVVYDTTQSLVDHGRLDVNLGGPPQFYSLRNGKKYGVFPLGNVIAMAPSYLAYRAARLLPHPPVVEDLLFRFCCHLTPSALIAGVAVLLFALARREGASDKAALWIALLLPFGTILFVYARVPFSEALQTMAMTWVFERALAVGDRPTRRGAFFLGVATGLLFNTKLVYAGAVATTGLYVALRLYRRPRQLVEVVLWATPPLAALVGLAVWHNHLKTGTLLDSGYRIPEGVFSGDAYAALYGYFLSPGKSVFLYSPPLVLGALAFPSYYRREREHALYLLALTAVVTGMNAKFRYWHADYCWGPRLLVPLVAIWLVPAAVWIEGALAEGRTKLRALSVGLLVGAALWVQVLGASFYWDHYIRIAIAVKDQTNAAGWYTEDLHHCHFIPQFSPLVGHSWLLRHTVWRHPDLMVDAPFHRVIAGKVNLTNEWLGLRYDWWALEWGYPREARVWFAVLLMLISAGVAGSGASLFRRLQRAERPSRISGVARRG